MISNMRGPVLLALLGALRIGAPSAKASAVDMEPAEAKELQRMLARGTGLYASETIPLPMAAPRWCDMSDFEAGLPGSWAANSFGTLARQKKARRGLPVEQRKFSRELFNYTPLNCVLRKFDTRDAVGRCFGGKKLVFVGDSLAEQQAKALVGMLVLHGVNSTTSPCADAVPGCTVTKLGVSIERLYGGPRLAETQLFSPFKASRFDPQTYNAIDTAARLQPGDIVVVSLSAHYKTPEELAAGIDAFFAWVHLGMGRDKVRYVFREMVPTHFPVPQGDYASFVADTEKRWPLRCGNDSLVWDSELMSQRWRNEVIHDRIQAYLAHPRHAAVDILPLFELFKQHWDGHPDGSVDLKKDCKGDPSRLEHPMKLRACKLDCLHYQPRFNQLANHILYNMLLIHPK
ncbi:hypothetical protein M885DRAFT_517861 [Pelagophyceae sp. CCMP2097]|nr:hypothetical protein M885DRAFT_517861 [Pelagophyceae sp. CCMP2097]|mmetsp:Transcript_14664/g.49193  ORF Transcript_14664/g.49193 Transcript_14664/m.49193 type:complete len:402 (-) Transcript_14664:15-1220(-)